MSMRFPGITTPSSMIRTSKTSPGICVVASTRPRTISQVSEVNTPIDAPADGPGNTAAGGPFGTAMPADLRQRSVRGGGAALLAQGLAFALQMGSMMVLARLLSPEDFGLQGMVVVM